MDRPRTPEPGRRWTEIALATGGVLAVGLLTLGLARLKPAAPRVDPDRPRVGARPGRGRERELFRDAVRMALGADAGHVLWLFVRRGLILTTIGLAAGFFAALGLTRLLAAFLYGVGPTDPATFVVVPVLFGAVAFLASYLPARRATRIDPMVALRCE